MHVVYLTLNLFVFMLQISAIKSIVSVHKITVIS